MKNLTLTCLILFMLLGLLPYSKAQTWSWRLGWSLSYTWGKIDGERQLNPNDYSMLKTTPGWSTGWSLDRNETGLSLFGNIMRLGIYSAGIERRLNNRWTLISGLEAGGRMVNYMEYAQNGRSGGDSEKDLANMVKRSFLVCSVPLLVKYKLYEKKIDYSLVGGLYLNEAFSSRKVTPFYITQDAYLFYPSLSIGFRMKAARKNGLAFECAYQQGFSKAIDDQILVRSSIVVLRNPDQVNATSLGSHLRVGLSYGLDLNPFERKKKASSSAFIPYQERGKGKVITIETLSDTFQVCFQDIQTVDTDSIRVVFNSSADDNLIGLLATPQCLSFDVRHQLTNTIDIYAVNEGLVKPNTMSVTYRDKKNRKKVLVLNNTMEQFIRIKVIYLK